VVADRPHLERVAELAEGIARLHGFASPPVLPHTILEEEPVSIFGEDFDSAFDGRLEYHKDLKHFGLYYNTYGRQQPYGRSRFSLAHELGHYVLDAHRHHLELGGDSHNSRAGFQIDSGIEREADVFAAHFLMPRYLLEDRINDPDMDTVIRLSSDFQTSLLCAARRFVDTTSRACTLVVSQGGRVHYSRHSEEMRALGYVYVMQGLELPAGRVVRKSRSGLEEWTHIEEKRSSSQEWSGNDRGPDRRLWMQTVHQPSYDRAITLLIYERGSEDDVGVDDD